MILQLITIIAIATIGNIIYECLGYAKQPKTTRYDSKTDQVDIDIKNALNPSKKKDLEHVDIESVEPTEFYSITWCGRSGVVVDIEFVEV